MFNVNWYGHRTVRVAETKLSYLKYFTEEDCGSHTFEKGNEEENFQSSVQGCLL